MPQENWMYQQLKYEVMYQNHHFVRYAQNKLCCTRHINYQVLLLSRYEYLETM